jgi:hypothetical protein
MSSIIYYFASNLLIVHNGISFLAKMKAIVKVALALSIPSWLITGIISWSVTNQEYIAGVLACIAIDHAIGSFYHAFKLRDFSFRKNIVGILYKVSLCASASILFEIIQHTIRDISLVYDYLKTTARLIIILYPASSAFLNMSALTNGVFPPLGWIKRISEYNKTLDLDKIYKNGRTNTAEDPTSSPQNQAGSI